jgi:hypothetical protein
MHKILFVLALVCIAMVSADIERRYLFKAQTGATNFEPVRGTLFFASDIGVFAYRKVINSQ